MSFLRARTKLLSTFASLLLLLFSKRCDAQAIRGAALNKRAKNVKPFEESHAVHENPFDMKPVSSSETHRRLAASEKLNPFGQPMFKEVAPNGLDPSFIYKVKGKKITIGMGLGVHETGRLDPTTGNRLKTPIYGYGEDGQYTWPGKLQCRSSY